MSRTTKQPKTGGKAVSCHCQNHGTCNYCRDNRTISSQRQESKAVLALREYLRTTPQEELDAITVQVNSLNIEGTTLKEVLATSPVWQLHLAEQQLLVARKALHDISTWSKQLSDDVVLHNSGHGIWQSCVTTALDAIRDMRNLKRK